jgi:sterol desaturase/sphingolipid hydroxylase (fatty acid hydroxylase superfamily)
MKRSKSNLRHRECYPSLPNLLSFTGVELMPRALADSRWFGWINATTHHDLHHSSFQYNYGLYFTWWDRLMGTEHPAYRAQLRGHRETAAAPDAVGQYQLEN